MTPILVFSSSYTAALKLLRSRPFTSTMQPYRRRP